MSRYLIIWARRSQLIRIHSKVYMIDNFLLDLLQGRVEELLEANLTSYAVAVIEDCSKRLDNYVNSEVLAAIQRTASKSWISGTPYAMKACMPDSSILLIDPRKLDKDLVEAILWWSKVLNWSERFGIHLLFILQFCGLFLPFCLSYKIWIHSYCFTLWLPRNHGSFVFNKIFHLKVCCACW